MNALFREAGKGLAKSKHYLLLVWPTDVVFFLFFFCFFVVFFESQNEGYMSYSAKGPSSTSCQNETPSVSGPDPFPPRAKNRERVWLRETNLYIRLSFSLSS